MVKEKKKNRKCYVARLSSPALLLGNKMTLIQSVFKRNVETPDGILDHEIVFILVTSRLLSRVSVAFIPIGRGDHLH